MSPYFGRYIGKNEVADETEFILLPLCDGSHFNGYIINIKKKKIIFVDSLHEIKCGTRSIRAKLKATYFKSDNNVTITSFLHKRLEFDGHSWLGWSLV